MDALLEIIDEVILTSGADHAAWSCGTSPDPEFSLFTEQNVAKMANLWTYGDAGTDAEARRIESALLRKGCRRIPSTGGQGAHFVYAYLSHPAVLH